MLDFGNELLLPTSYGGAKILREAIADYLADSKQLSVSPDQIVVGAGTEYLYGMLIRLLGYNKVYGVEDPGYHKIRRVYHSSHVICRSIRLDKDGVPPQELEAANIDILHFSPSHHFPTGMVTPVSRRLQLLDYVTQQKGRYIIEDDYDSEFRFVGKPIPPMQSLDSQGKVIYMNTFSKTLAPSIRISYIVLPPELATEYQEKLGFYSCTVPSFEQYTLARFINQGYLERHIYRMRKHYREIRNLCLDSLKNSKLQKYISVSEEDAGLHFLLRIHTQKSDAEICSQLKRAGIRVSALSEYYATPPEEPTHTLVINYSGADEKSIHTALERLERIFL
jgi:GntR family transcriptional regulator/MocR family aminotransferase